MMKKYLAYGILFSLILAGSSFAADLPMLPVNITPKTQSKPVHPLNNYNYPNYNMNINGSNYYNIRYCPYGCLYSTTLTSSELRAVSDARRRARLEAKCRANKAKKSKCDELTED